MSVRHNGTKLLVKCFAADCSVSDILTSIGLKFHDLHDQPLPTQLPANTVRTHDYLDAKGEVVGFATRQEPKTFRPLTRDPVTGLWRTGSNDELKRTPYQLPEVLSAVAAGEPVWIVEGENDCDKLRDHGVVATTNLGGAGKWTEHHARVLLGADIVICRDNDAPGEKHAAAVLASLRDVAASIRFVRPADGHKDIGDQLASGLTVADVVDVEPPAKFTEVPAPSSWTPVDLSVVLADGYVPPAATLGRFGGTGGLFYPGEVNTIAGPSGSGKTWIALSVVAEELLAGHSCLYVDHEATAGVTASRLRALGVPVDVILRYLTYVNPSDPHTVDLDAWESILDRSFSVAIVDGVTAAMSLYGGGTNEQDAVARWFVDVPTKLARRTGAAVITVDHVSKTGADSGFAVGSQHKRAAVTGVSFNVEVVEYLGKGLTGKLKLSIGKDRHGESPRDSCSQTANTRSLQCWCSTRTQTVRR